ncbi:MAG: hypothetical protein JSU70_02890 [Phycisphaerales bacterium]|nr:MAG: hypothetical protein JSU70_02890 [Phycisphaerales bacterium]
MSTEKSLSKWTRWLAITVFLLAWGAVAAADEVCPVEIPFDTLWAGSGHADAEAEAFRHWDEDDPPEISTRCAKCHSTPGYLDFLGADGTAAGTVENAAPIGTTVECVACHNEATAAMDSVIFPSGIEISGLGAEARCMQCHQGRASGVSVDDKIADANLPDDDTAGLSFTNVHYYAAGATLMGGEALGGYQYAGKTYDVKFAHVDGIDTCVDCHSSHSLQVKVGLCSDCHGEVTGHEDLHGIRFEGSTVDYDGDSDVAEGIHGEIEGLLDILYMAMQANAKSIGAAIGYESHSYPYFFNDTNGDGVIDESEADRANGYSFTARLLRAAYNYQFVLKDPGGFAHNGKYIIQLLYDSIEDLDPALVAGLHRDDAGHFAGSKEAFRHWDEDGEVSGRCSKCHSATGLPFYLKEGVTASQPVSNGLLCTTCHSSLDDFSRYAVDEVEFPSGSVVSFGEGEDSNICINCHQGRESTVSVNATIAGRDLDTPSSSVRFRNIHYFAAGATLFGSEAKGAYEYTGKSYNGRFEHVGSYDTCAECHGAHDLELNMHACASCHKRIAGPHDIRMSATDFDGDGDTSEGIAGEVDTMRDALYAAMQDYAATVAGLPILYDAHSYPYFFIDTNGNGQSDEGEATRSNSYNAFTPRLLQAAYNYQYVMKDPGAFAHNGKYMIQVLYDGLASLGTQVTVDMAGMVRPDAEGASEVCGDATHPYPTGDLNQDCRVDSADLAIFCTGWLEDNSPL